MLRSAMVISSPLPWQQRRQLLERMGYQARLTKASHDAGIDTEAFDPQPIRGGKIVVQCKKYSNVVGASYVRNLYGVIQHEGATKGILITTSHFSSDARTFAHGKPSAMADDARTQPRVNTGAYPLQAAAH
jgi:restriction system protein